MRLLNKVLEHDTNGTTNPTDLKMHKQKTNTNASSLRVFWPFVKWEKFDHWQKRFQEKILVVYVVAACIVEQIDVINNQRNQGLCMILIYSHYVTPTRLRWSSVCFTWGKSKAAWFEIFKNNLKHCNNSFFMFEPSSFTFR